MATTLAARLTSIQTAIESLESGAQRVDHNGRSVTYADLATLYKQERHLEQRIARQGRVSRTVAEM